MTSWPHHRPRITPACAGSSRRRSRGRGHRRDHPRVRGEQVSGRFVYVRTQGSPPRARGAAEVVDHAAPGVGITPACAGSSGASGASSARTGDHPRVRGEQTEADKRWLTRDGSPPRARGAGRPDRRHGHRRGITPACAGSSAEVEFGAPCSEDHPRVRGEQVSSVAWPHLLTGSPPRARGADVTAVPVGPPPGITPACAGSRGVQDPAPAPDEDHPRVRGEQGCAGPRACP